MSLLIEIESSHFTQPENEAILFLAFLVMQ